MTESRDLSGFLMETWQALVSLEAAVESLSTRVSTGASETTDRVQARASSVAASRRLQHTANEHGFPVIARLAGRLARLASQLPGQGPAATSATVIAATAIADAADDEHHDGDAERISVVSGLLREALGVLPRSLEKVATGGDEKIDEMADLEQRIDHHLQAFEGGSGPAREIDSNPEPRRASVDHALSALREADPEAMTFFVPEAREYLAGLAHGLEPSRSVLSDPEGLHTLFRQVHTLKGAAFTVGCEPIGLLAHRVEDLLGTWRDRSSRPTREGLTALSAARGLMSEMVERLDGGAGPSIDARFRGLVATFEELGRAVGARGGEPFLGSGPEPGPEPSSPSGESPSGGSPSGGSPSGESPSPSSPSTRTAPTVRWPAEDWPTDDWPTDDWPTDDWPTGPGSPAAAPTSPSPASPTPASPTPASPTPTSPSPASSGALEPGEIRVGQRLDPDEIQAAVASLGLDALAPAEGLPTSAAAAPSDGQAPAAPLAAVPDPVLHSAPGARSEPAPDLDPDSSAGLEAGLSPGLAPGMALDMATGDQVTGLPTSEPGFAASLGRRLTPSFRRSLRPDMGRLDTLLAGLEKAGRSQFRLQRQLAELRHALDASRPAESADAGADSAERDREEALARRLHAAESEAARGRELQESLEQDLRAVRTVPAGQLFGRFSRLVRALATETGKAVVLETSGDRIEVDYRVLERLAEPLTHLVTNALHHGIERVSERRELEKDDHGTIVLSAGLSGRRLWLEVADDGRGIDPLALRRRAEASGLIEPGDPRWADERAALDLIFLPGLTTAARVTTAAGRGVGMDAVRHALERLGGRIEVDSRVGEGTRARLEVPRSLDWLDLVRVRVGGIELALPSEAVARVHAIAAGGSGIEGVSELVPLAERLGLAAAPESAGAESDVGGPIGWAVELHPAPATVGFGQSGQRGQSGQAGQSGRGDAAGPAGADGDRESSTSVPAGRALRVDAVLDAVEMRLRPLGPLLERSRLYRGAVIGADGRVVPVLDPWLAAELPSSLEAVPGPQFAPSAPLPVLVVDDSLSVRRVLRRILERAGERVATARDGTEAVEWLAENQAVAIVTDLEMPRTSGLELIEAVRRGPGGQSMPIAVLTTRTSERVREQARSRGVDLFLAKPVDTEALGGWLASLSDR